MNTQPQWTRDTIAENGMRHMGVTDWQEVQVPLSQIDLEEGLRRQARAISRLDDTTVIQYAIAWDEGARFPMVILQQLAKNRFFPWSGNHRLAALDYALDPGVDRSQILVSAYALKLVDVRQLDLLPRLVNCWVGKGLSLEERVANAQWYIEKHNAPVTDVARMFGLKPEQVNTTRRAEDTKIRLASLGVAAGRFPKMLLLELFKIDNDNVLKAAAEFISRCGVRGNEAIQVIKDVRRLPTESQMIGEIGRWEKVVSDRNRPRKSNVETPLRQPMRTEFLRALTTLSRCLEKGSTLEQFQLYDPADVSAGRANSKKVIDKLQYLFFGNGK
jgi:hypothetical protein